MFWDVYSGTHSLTAAAQYVCKIPQFGCNTPLYDCKPPQNAYTIPLLV